MQPIIGIIPSIDEENSLYFVHKDNVNAIKEAGGLPILLPYNFSHINKLMNVIDGLYLTGGYDIDPTFFGEEPHPNLGVINRIRDKFEIEFVQKFLTKRKPILAVCKGSQIVNIALGGDMYQDMYSQIRTPLLQHQQQAIKQHASHFVKVVEGSLLHKLVGKSKIKVNSRHHQANRNIGNNLKVSGKSSDGIIESIEGKENSFLLGLQWHPENMACCGDDLSMKIYKGFINACKNKGGNLL